MSEFRSFAEPVQPNWQGLVDDILRKGTPDRAYHIELFHDGEVAEAIIDRFDVAAGLDPGDPEYGISKGRLLPDHKLLGPEEVTSETAERLAQSLVLIHGGMAQNVGPILEMVTESKISTISGPGTIFLLSNRIL